MTPPAVRFVVDRLLPAGLTGDALRRARIVGGLNVALVVMGAAALVFWVATRGPTAPLTVVVALDLTGLVVSLVVLRYSWRVPTVLLIGLTWATVVGTSLVEGGLHAPTLMFIGLPPLFAALLSRWRTTAAVALASVAAVFGFYVAGVHGVALPAPPPDPNPERTTMFLLALFLVVLTVMARLYDRSRAGAEARLHAEIARREQTEIELRLAQRLEAVGQLAAGVAHEINNPLQYVHDSVQFVGQSLPVMTAMLERYRELAEAVAAGECPVTEAKQALAQEVDADIAFVLENAPGAIEATQDGLQRIASIVRSMRAFSSHDRRTPGDVDLNDAVRNMLTLAQGDLREVAQVETELTDLPRVKGFGDEVSVALLAIVLNGAQAIGEVVKTGALQLGRLTVTTRRDRDEAVVSISDTGAGIPASIQDRIFDPFFTTKGVGHGLGQGLYLARKVIVERHRGKLSFDTRPGAGTTFEIRLPIAAPEAHAA